MVVSCATPKTILASHEGEDPWNHDFPPITLTGDMADQVNEQYNIGDRVAVIGRLNTRQRMVYEGNSLYREVWESSIIPETVYPYTGNIDGNEVVLSGTISRVYENRDRHFYIVTIETDGPKEKEHMSAIFHDSRLRLAPKVGERAMVVGTIQTRRIEGQDMRGRARTRYMLSVFAKALVIARENTRELQESSPQRRRPLPKPDEGEMKAELMEEVTEEEVKAGEMEVLEEPSEDDFEFNL